MLQRLTENDTLESIINCLNRDGAVILTGIMNDVELHNFKAEISGLLDQSHFCHGPFFGERTKRVHSLIAKSKMCQKLASSEKIIGIIQSVLGPLCEKIQINLTQGIQIWPDEQRQLLHRDDSMYPGKNPEHEYLVNVMWACSDFTKTNGATVIAPGSHRWTDRNRRPMEQELVQAEMKAGEALIYVGSVIHAGGRNSDTFPRTGVVIGYSLGWLRQYENQYFAVPPAIAKSLPDELQDLLGYAVHRPNLGMYEGNEPKILLRDSTGIDITTRDWLTPQQYEQINNHYVSRHA